MDKEAEEKTIHFHYENIDFQLSDESKYLNWVKMVFEENKARYATINYIFCDDEYLLDVNHQYLNHNYYTDIISFPYAEHPEPVSGDIFISVDRVKDNAVTIGVTFENELRRVMAHGILHFLGYKDKKVEDQKMMRSKENEMIHLF